MIELEEIILVFLLLDSFVSAVIIALLAAIGVHTLLRYHRSAPVKPNTAMIWSVVAFIVFFAVIAVVYVTGLRIGDQF